MENIVSEELNKIIAVENKRQDQFISKKTQKRGFSIDKAASWVR